MLERLQCERQERKLNWYLVYYAIYFDLYGGNRISYLVFGKQAEKPITLVYFKINKRALLEYVKSISLTVIKMNG